MPDPAPPRNAAQQPVARGPGRRRARRIVGAWRVVRVVVLAAIVLAMADYVRRAAPDLRAMTLRPTWLAVVMAAGGAVAWIVMQAALWKRVLGAAGFGIALRTALPQVWLPNLGKYVPGKVWAAVGRVFLCKLSGIPGPPAAVALFVENVCFILAGAVFAAILLPLSGAAEQRELRGLLMPLGLTVAAGFLIVHPVVWGTVARVLLRWLRRPVVAVPFSYPTLLAFVSLYVLSWSLLGVGMFGFARMVDGVTAAVAVRVAALYVIAWSLGYVSMLAPAGLGVREGILMAGLSGTLGAEAIIALAVGLRLYFSAVDVLAAALAAAVSPALVRALAAVPQADAEPASPDG